MIGGNQTNITLTKSREQQGLFPLEEVPVEAYAFYMEEIRASVVKSLGIMQEHIDDWLDEAITPSEEGDILVVCFSILVSEMVENLAAEKIVTEYELKKIHEHLRKVSQGDS